MIGKCSSALPIARSKNWGLKLAFADWRIEFLSQHSHSPRLRCLICRDFVSAENKKPPTPGGLKGTAAYLA